MFMFMVCLVVLMLAQTAIDGASVGGADAGADGADDLPSLVAGLPDGALDEHLSKDARGEFGDDDEGKDPGKPATPAKKDAPADSLEKRLQDKEAMIGKQSTEIGALRGQVDSFKGQVSVLQEQLTRAISIINGGKAGAGDPGKPEPNTGKISPDAFFEDPEKFISDIIGKTVPQILAGKDKAQNEEKNKAETARQQNISAVIDKVPAEEFRGLLPTIVEILVEDEVEQKDIEAFINDPFAFSSKAILGLVKRARLMEQVKTGGGKAPANPPAKANPAKPASSGASLNSKTGRGTESGRRSGSVSPEQLSEMSDEELDAYLKQLNGG